MTEMLLTVALMAAITLDIIRVRQYIQTRSELRNDATILLMHKIKKLYYRWCNDMSISDDFPDYCEEHWNDDVNDNGNEQLNADNVKNEC